MSVAIHDQRPRFYEGQYLGADDLSALVAYLRTSDARRALGGHTWGIAIGLQLTEKSAPGGSNRVEVTLQPGFGWDGYARHVLNPRPTRLPEELFESIPFHPVLDDVAAGGTGRLVPVWLAYDEIATGNPAPGFETCATDDQQERITETFRFVIGQQPTSKQRGTVLVGTTAVDAAAALTTFDASAATLFDASVPHQQFPFDGKPPHWLIPAGYVRWIARDQALGYFADRELAPADKAADRTRAFRRYIGTVAEYIEAADGAIVLHHRGRRPDDAHLFSNLLAGTLDAKALLDDLVWVQGNLRVVGHTKLAGGDLHFRNADGLHEGTPFYVARRGDNPASGLPGNRELRIVIGPGSQTDNRLFIGSEQPPVAPATDPTAAPHLVVVSSGRVGVGTSTPATSLEVAGNWNGTDGAIRVTGDQPAIRFQGGAAAGNQKWVAHVNNEGPGNLRFAVLDPTNTWKGVLHVTPAARVGVGSPAPRNPLAVRAAGQSEELVSFEDAGGTTKWHVNQNLNGNTPGLNIVETGVEDARLFFKPGGETGIGTTAPTGRLTLKGKNPFHGTLSFFSATADVEYDGGVDNLFVFKHATNGVTSFVQTRIGIDTTNPQEKLHVAGPTMLVDGPTGELVVLGAEGQSAVTLGTRNPAVTNADMRRLNVAFDTTNANAWLNLWCRDVFEVSDARAKTDVATIEGALDRVSRLRGVSYYFKGEAVQPAEPKRLGLIAQEVAQVVPEAARVEDRRGGVSYSTLVPLLIEAIKELRTEVEALRKDVTRLKGTRPRGKTTTRKARVRETDSE